jgi:transmembrane sensor
MDFPHTYDDIPWELIESALQGTLSPEEELRFREWQSASTTNQQKYEQLQDLWKNALTDYEAYRKADAEKAWESLQDAINEKKIIRPYDFARRLLIRRLAAAAVVLLLVTFIGLRYRPGRAAAAVPYETAGGEQRKISLPDGSIVDLSPRTRIEVAGDYDKGGRTVSLVSGEAQFAVTHHAQSPFRVEMGAVSVRDIGTVFKVERTKDSIHVRVSEGKIAFVKKETGESRELSAGNSIVFYVAENRFGEVMEDTAGGPAGSRRFYDSPLEDVIRTLEKESGRKIILGDGVAGQKRLTVDLTGISVEDALKVICASLDLEYTESNGGYILKGKGGATSH